MGATKTEWTEAIKSGHKITRKDGYVLVRCPEYPGSKPNGYVMEHRLVVAIAVGRPLKSSEAVHHINGNRSDNRLENLYLTNHRDHAINHMKGAAPSRFTNAIAALRRCAAQRKLQRTTVLCACGCGASFVTPDDKGRFHKFAHGHNNRGKHWQWSRLTNG